MTHILYCITCKMKAAKNKKQAVVAVAKNLTKINFGVWHIKSFVKACLSYFKMGKIAFISLVIAAIAALLGERIVNLR